MENRQILYCILGSVILSLVNIKQLIVMHSVTLFSESVEIAANIGTLLTIVFSVILIMKNINTDSKNMGDFNNEKK